MTIQQPPPTRPRARSGDHQRRIRRYGLALMLPILFGSLGVVVWNVWSLEDLAGRLRATPVKLEKSRSVRLAHLETRVVSHQGPGDSAFFDLGIRVEVTCLDMAPIREIRIGGRLLNADGARLLPLRPVVLQHMLAGETRVVELVRSPVPRPVAEQLSRVLVYAR